VTDRHSSNLEAAAHHAREADAGPDPDVPSRAELAAEAHADRALERERTVQLAGMLLCAEAHVTQALDELAYALELWPGDELVDREGKALMEIAERLGLRAERLREPGAVCGRLLVGQGGDTWDPVCVRPVGHTGVCKAVRCVACAHERKVRAGEVPKDVPMCARCFSPMVAVRAERGS
jgi:hypothetical protein